MVRDCVVVLDLLIYYYIITAASTKCRKAKTEQCEMNELRGENYEILRLKKKKKHRVKK